MFGAKNLAPTAYNLGSVLRHYSMLEEPEVAWPSLCDALGLSCGLLGGLYQTVKDFGGPRAYKGIVQVPIKR